MKFVLCDDDELFRSLVEAVVSTHEHEVVGVADGPVAAIGLVEHAKADVLIVDPSVGIGTDFDVIASANATGTRVIVFSRSGEIVASGRYSPEPTLVLKPDIALLEQTIERLTFVQDRNIADVDRRKRPPRAANGPVPTGPTDAAAFYEALNNSTAGDALLAVVPRGEQFTMEVATLAEGSVTHIRETDRLLASSSSLVFLLPGAGDIGVDSLLLRLQADVLPATEVLTSWVIIEPGESPGEAFDRLRRR